MFGRLSYGTGDPGRIDDLITYVRTVVKPATDQLEGNHGLGMWVNRTTGDALVITVWDDEATLRASEQAVLKLRDDAAGIIGGTATVERYETLLVDAVEPHHPGYVARLLRMKGDPSALEADAQWAREEVVPTMRAVPGYVSYVVSVDRATGAAIAMSTYRDGESAHKALAATAPLRDALGARGITVDSMLDYEVAIVGIRAPMADVPPQRAIDLTTDAGAAPRR